MLIISLALHIFYVSNYFKCHVKLVVACLSQKPGARLSGSVDTACN